MKEAPPARPRLRRLSDEEIALWAEVARSVERRRGATLPTPSKAYVPAPPSAPPATPAPPEMRPAKPGALPLAPIERRLKRELARGRGAVDGALDLHGLNSGRGASGAARLSPPFAVARREARHRRHRQGRSVWRGATVGGVSRRAPKACPPLAARVRPPQRRARLRRGGAGARGIGRALCAAAPAPGLGNAKVASGARCTRNCAGSARTP